MFPTLHFPTPYILYFLSKVFKVVVVVVRCLPTLNSFRYCSPRWYRVPNAYHTIPCHTTRYPTLLHPTIYCPHHTTPCHAILPARRHTAPSAKHARKSGDDLHAETMLSGLRRKLVVCRVEPSGERPLRYNEELYGQVHRQRNTQGCSQVGSNSAGRIGSERVL